MAHLHNIRLCHKHIPEKSRRETELFRVNHNGSLEGKICKIYSESHLGNLGKSAGDMIYSASVTDLGYPARGKGINISSYPFLFF